MSKLMSRKGRKGFTLVELAVVIVIIGVLASFGVPKFMQSVERSKAAESFNFLSAVRDAEERYQAKEGTYTTDCSQLDIAWKSVSGAPVLQYFTITSITATTSTWTSTLTRLGTAGSYGAYTVVYTQDGFDTSSTIDPLISPLGNQAAASGSGGSGS
jgi:prepilin-type N-terminal cleavage/methylation domain-containing protein